ncbi:MAG: hypothetical protein M1838_002831 [Thelocarpon superellum]|nr:MAG: hypothetical protein M1838_002831 [Thelocarpon superellum]
MAAAAVAASLTSPAGIQSIEYQLAHQDEDRSLGLKIVLFVGVVISTIAVSLRFYSRRMSRTPLGADDWVTIVALAVTYAAFIIIAFMLYPSGLGRHQVILSVSTLERDLKLLYAFLIVYSAAYPLIKISILLLFHRVFVIRRFQLFIRFWTVFVAFQALAAIFTSVFFCMPINGFWDINQPAQCVSDVKSYVAHASLNVCTDLVVLISPMPIIWNLCISRQQKIVVSAIFALGSLVFICTVFRIVAFYQIDDFDRTWTYINTAYWTISELSLGMLCACLPTMRPLFRRVFTLSLSSGSSGSQRPLRLLRDGKWISIREYSARSKSSVPSQGSQPSSTMSPRAKPTFESPRANLNRWNEQDEDLDLDMERGDYAAIHLETRGASEKSPGMMTDEKKLVPHDGIV